MSIYIMHVIVLIGELFAQALGDCLVGCKALICFNLDDRAWSVPWAPINSPERHTNKSSCCQFSTLCCIIDTVGIFPPLNYWVVFTRSQDKIGCWPGTHSLQRIIKSSCSGHKPRSVVNTSLIYPNNKVLHNTRYNNEKLQTKLGQNRYLNKWIKWIIY